MVILSEADLTSDGVPKQVVRLEKDTQLSLFCDPEHAQGPAPIKTEREAYEDKSFNGYVLLARLRFDRVSLKSLLYVKAGRVSELHIVGTSHMV